MTKAWAKQTKSGFTIVELLIVIVVIGILAGIVIVAYNGVRDRAHNTAVQSDLKNLAQKLAIYRADHSQYPAGGNASGSSTTFPGINFLPTKDSYDTINTNLYYCTGNIDGKEAYVVRARSKSRDVFEYSSYNGPRSLGQASLGSTIICQDFDTGTTSFSYGYNPGPSYGWFAWTNSN